MQKIGRVFHKEGIQRSWCGGRWDIRRNVKYKPNGHVSTTTPKGINTGVKTKWWKWRPSVKWSRRWNMTNSDLMHNVRGSLSPEYNSNVCTRTSGGWWDARSDVWQANIKGPEITWTEWISTLDLPEENIHLMPINLEKITRVIWKELAPSGLV